MNALDNPRGGFFGLDGYPTNPGGRGDAVGSMNNPNANYANPKPAPAPNGSVNAGLPGESPNQISSPLGAAPSGAGAQDPTLGAGSFPWLQRWQGGYQAPTSPWENQALGSIQNMASGDFGLDNSQGYINDLLGEKWLDPNNKYFDQIQQGAGQLKDTQDQRALQQLQSSAAAGGNALSGGLLQNENDYMHNSNASFDQMMAQLRANQYSQERGYMQQAPGMQNNLTNTGLGGIQQEMMMGAVPRQIQSNEMQGQYQDWLRQIQGLQGAYYYPDQMGMSMLNGGGYRQTYQPTTGESGGGQLAQILQMLAGGGNGSGIDYGSLLSGLGGLFGGGSGSTTDGGDNSAATATDAHPVHYNATPANPMTSSPFSYQDQNYYNQRLSGEQGAEAQSHQQQNVGMNTGLGTAALLIQLLKLLGGGKSQSNKAKTGVGMGGPGGGSGSKNPNNPDGSRAKPPGPYDNVIGGANDPFANSLDTPGSPYYNDPNGLFDPNNFAGAQGNSGPDYGNYGGQDNFDFTGDPNGFGPNYGNEGGLDNFDFTGDAGLGYVGDGGVDF